MDNFIPKIIHYWVFNDEILNEANILNIHKNNKNYKIFVHSSNKIFEDSLIKKELGESIAIITHDTVKEELYQLAIYFLYYYGGVLIKQKGNESSFEFEEFSFDFVIDVMKEHEHKKICILKQNNSIIVSKPKVKILLSFKNIFEENDIEENLLPFFIILPLRKIFNNKINEEGKNLKIEPFENPIPFYFINLKHRPERHISFLISWGQIASSLNVKLVRFDAFKHRDGNIRTLNGCSQSHFEIIENELIKKNKNYVIVMEDDAMINPKLSIDEFNYHFTKVIEYVEKNYDKFDILTLGTSTIANVDRKEFIFEPVSENIAKVSSFNQSHFLIYTKGIIPHFYKFFAEVLLRKTKHSDQDSYFKFTKGLRCMMTYPILSCQNFSFISDVIGIYRSGDYYDTILSQIEIGLAIYNTGYRGNYYDLIKNSKYENILKEW
jgi:hypothetical protein